MAGSPSYAASIRLVNKNVPHIARIYDYWLGGKDNFAVDREAADQAIAAYPGILRSVQTNRGFLARSTRYFAAELGIRQFLDIGTGIPTASNTHQVAQAVDPSCRIVYVDNDPMVLAHAAALLTSSAEGACAYVDSDMNDTASVLAKASQTLDFTKPVAVMMVSVLHFATVPALLVRSLMDATRPGSGFAISHPASDLVLEQQEMVRRLNQLLSAKTTLRDQAEVTALFDGYRIASPGVVPAVRWRPGPDDELDAPCGVWAGAAIKD